MRYGGGFVLIEEEKLNKLVEHVGQLMYFSDIGEYKANALKLKSVIKPILAEIKI